MTLPTLDVVKTFPTSKDIPPNYGRISHEYPDQRNVLTKSKVRRGHNK